MLKGGTVQVFLITNICSFQPGGSQLPGLTFIWPPVVLLAPAVACILLEQIV